MLGEKVVCAAISPHLCMLSHIQVQCCPLLWLLHSDFGDFLTLGILIMEISCSDDYYIIGELFWLETVRCQ